jgi:acyl carrier protein
MVPSRIHVVPELPLASSGKVDLDTLLAALAPTGMSEPTGEVGELWAELLGPAGPDDDFFDAGGHSITAMRLVAAIRARLGKDVAVEDVLASRTLRAIAARVAGAPTLPDEPPVRGRGPALSPAQRRLWFLEQFGTDAAAAYHIAFAERLRGPLDIPALRAALAAVATRHEILRWRIVERDGEPVAVADQPGPVPLPVADLDEHELPTRLSAMAREPFRLATDTLWRTRLFRLGPEDHVLAVTAHHAVFDGWSQAQLYRDVAAAYAGAALAPLPATYGDYVAWRADRQRRRSERDLAWWVSHLDGVPTVLELPGDAPRPAEQTFAGASTALSLDSPTTARIAELAAGQGATPSAVLLTALGIVAARLTGLTDLVIGTPTVDRRETDFEDLIGFFVEIAPLRLRIDQHASFAEQVRATRDELLDALAHPEAPLERIVPALGLGGRLDRGPLVQVLFNMFNFPAPALDLPGTTSEPVRVTGPGSPFDLTVYGIERDGRLCLEVVYNTDLFTEARMAALLDALREVVTHGVADPDAPTGKLAPALIGPASPPEVPRARPRPASAPVTEPPVTPTERTIAALWCEVLGRDAVGATESFFDAGGSSLSIVVVQQRLNRLLEKDLRVVDLFRYPTVRALASHLDGSGGSADAAVERAAQRGAARRARQRRSTRDRL